MLQKLLIQNVALIEREEITFSEGINVLSGETGAGKSIILDAIDFVLGAKADRSIIRSGAEFCLVRAEFTGIGDAVNAVLAELDLEAEETLILSRRLSADGKGSMKINGCTVTASMLRRVTSQLVDVHGQSEHFFLLKESNQLRLLDTVAGRPADEAKRTLAALLAQRKTTLAELRLLGGDEGERTRRLDILRFQIDEIKNAALREGEEEELLAFRTRYRNAEKIMNALSAAREALTADGGGADSANSAAHALSSVSGLDERYGALSERLEAVAAEITDIADTLESYADETDIDEREAERAEARLDELRKLKKKYGSGVPEIFRFLAEAEHEYEALSDSGERMQLLSAQLEHENDEIYAACLRLTEARRAAAADFTARVTEELKTLNIASAKFEVAFGPYTRDDAASATADGLGSVRFLFSANRGEPLKELGKIISGGEMSRFMLAVKAQLSSINSIGTYLFDEIDAGIGGKTARIVAEKFCRIAQTIQIIAVSHLAQIASFADREFYIEKQEMDGRTYTRILLLEGEERVKEIARLIGGDQESAVALSHARELLSGAEAYKRALRR